MLVLSEKLSSVSALMECLCIREEESIGSRVFRFIPVVPLLGWEVSKGFFIFLCFF